LSPKPDRSAINFYINDAGERVDLTQSGMTFQTSILGDPGAACRTAACVGCGCRATSRLIRDNLERMDVGPFTVTTLRPFGILFKQVMEEVKTARPELFWGLRTAGSSCCRPPKIRGVVKEGSLSNHAWGAAIDVYYGPSNDVQGDNKAQDGLLALSRYMNDKKIYWGAAFTVEDAMHFEPSKQLLIEWVCTGQLTGVTSVPHHPCPNSDSNHNSDGFGGTESPFLNVANNIHEESADSGSVDDILTPVAAEPSESYLASEEAEYENEAAEITNHPPDIDISNIV
jgi:hypothetical protein